jgi:DNA/RNA endonuclease YhcR with UshA esterase domain
MRGLTWLLCVPFLWVAVAAAADPPKPLTVAEAAQKVGEEVTLRMEVKAAAKSGAVAFLNSETNHRSPKNFTIFLNPKVLSQFADADIEDPVAHFKGKTVEVKGKVTLHMEKPQIILDSAKAIKIIDEKKADEKPAAEK